MPPEAARRQAAFWPARLSHQPKHPARRLRGRHRRGTLLLGGHAREDVPRACGPNPHAGSGGRLHARQRVESGLRHGVRRRGAVRGCLAEGVARRARLGRVRVRVRARVRVRVRLSVCAPCAPSVRSPIDPDATARAGTRGAWSPSPGAGCGAAGSRQGTWWRCRPVRCLPPPRRAPSVAVRRPGQGRVRGWG